MAETTERFSEGYNHFQKISYPSRLKMITREIWLTLHEEGYESELKIDEYIDYYMEFFRQRIEYDEHNFNDLREDVKKNIKGKYEKYKIAQCSVCGETGKGYDFWGRTDIAWKYKVCKKCNAEIVECYCCGASKERKYYPLIEEEGRYSDVCVSCTNKAKQKTNKEMTSLELEDYAVALKEAEIKEIEALKNNQHDILEYELKKGKYATDRVGICKVCGKIKVGVKDWGRIEWGFKSGICTSCRTEGKIICQCCKRPRKVKSFEINPKTNTLEDTCKYCKTKLKK